MVTRVGTQSGRRVAVSFTFDFDAESAWLGSFKVDTLRPSRAARMAPTKVCHASCGCSRSTPACDILHPRRYRRPSPG
jgi:hypothetical protein